MDRPLGQPPAGSGGRPPRPDFRTIAAALVALVLVVISALIALRDRPYRVPARIAVSTPEAPSAEGEASPAGNPLPPPAGAAPQNPASGSGGSIVVLGERATKGQAARIAHLPDRELIEESEAGPLPVRAPDGRRPFDVYARPWSGARGARVAIVIGGLGVSQTGTQHAIEKLPPEVTLAFASQGNSLDRWMQAGRQAGHEIVMQVPMEPYDYPRVDPGRDTLKVEADPAGIVADLHRTLARMTNYTGIMNYMGARFTADPDAMQVLMAELAKRGLGYLDDGSSARSLAEEVAARNGVPFAGADMRIDASQERGDILGKLDDLERTARAKGFALGVGSAFGVTVDAVATWANEARKRGIEIVPFSALADDPERR